MKLTSLASKFVKEPPKQSNHDWSFIHGTSMGVGPIYPLDVAEVNAGDSYIINPNIEIQTQPLVRPVLGRMNFDIYFFYSPQSLYGRALHSNTGLSAFSTVGNPLEYSFPYFRLESQRALKYKVSDNGDASDIYEAVTYIDNHAPQAYHPSALLGRLMLPPNYVDSTISSALPNGFVPTATHYNALPLLLYLDICRSWFGNRQYSVMPFLTASSTGASQVSSVSFASLDSLFTDLTDGAEIINYAASVTAPMYNFTQSLRLSKQVVPGSGLFLSAQYPDINNTLLNATANKNFATQSVVPSIEGGGIAMDTFAYSAKLWNFFNVVSLVGDKYDDFSRGVYNVKPDVHLNKPVFLGKRSVPIYFNQIRSTVGTEDAPLGTLGGNGFASFTPRRQDAFRFSFSERGYLMVIGVIRPENMYSQNLPRWATKTTLADAFYPQFNGIGFEDEFYTDLRGSISPSQLTVSGLINGNPPAFKTAIAKRPAWTEFRGRTNRLSGLAADPTGIKPWFISFEYNYITDSTAGGRSSVGDFLPWHYVDPARYGDLFAQSNREAENFIVRIGYDWIARSSVSKRVQPFLTI